MAQSTQAEFSASPPRLLPWPFVLAVLLLVATAALMGPGIRLVDVKQAKLPLALKAPLATLNERAIHPYRVVRRQILDDAIIDALGTDIYLKWTLEDTSVPADDPLRHADLFVTYYTGGSNLVPHTPDVCYLGQGYEPAQPHENRDVDVPSLRPDPPRVPIRLCTFAKTAIFKSEPRSVAYTFHCNGGFLVRSRAVRVRINTPTNAYAYFSKVEVSFPRASRSDTVRGAAKLFDRVMPVLIRDHWPDFEAAEQAQRDEPDPEN